MRPGEHRQRTLHLLVGCRSAIALERLFVTLDAFDYLVPVKVGALIAVPVEKGSKGAERPAVEVVQRGSLVGPLTAQSPVSKVIEPTERGIVDVGADAGFAKWRKPNMLVSCYGVGRCDGRLR